MTYQEQIINATGCNINDASEIERIMRQHVFQSELDGLTARQFIAGARKAAEFLEYSRSPEGIAYGEQVDREML